MCILEILFLRRISLRKLRTQGRDNFDHYDKGERKVCQGKLCSSSIETGKEVAVKVCHHEDCQEINNGNPLLLCLKCDEVHHLGAASNHARFDVLERPSTNLFRTPSAGSDSGNEDDLESEPNNKGDKKHRGYSTGKRMFKLNTAAKKKPRRHNTDDPGRDFFSIKFFDHKSGEFHINLVPALSGKSLRDSIEPLFESQNFSFTTHSVFLDSSNTPLPLAFDTFPLGGNVLHVRANADMKVDQRIIDMVSVEEGMTRPKSSSFLHRSGSFTTKGSKDKGGTVKKAENEDKDSGKEDKLLQQFNKTTQRGKKSMEALFGKEFGGMQPQPSSPVLHGGMYTGGSGSMPRPKSAGRLQGLFNQPKSMKGTLKDALDRYSLYGLEENSSYDCNFKSEIEDIIKLETSWTEVVNEAHIKAMSKKQKDQQEAIWELLSTEAAYIAKLHVIKKLFVQCLRNLQSEGFLTEIEGSKLFSNVEDIYTVNLAFWMANLSGIVENARQTKDPLNPLDMEQGFNMFESHFDPYIQYCMEEANCLKYFKEKLLENEEFRTYISWCEDHPYCTDRLKLNDFLVKPMQRVTKYPLLVRAIYNKTLDIEVKEHLTKMRDRVESFVSKVNGAMRVRHELEKLKATAERIQNNYNVVEAVNEEMDKILQEYSSYDLMRPMPGLIEDEHRCVIHEGPLRLLEKQGKMDVYVFLFTDLLLITKAKKGGDRFKVIKPPLQVDKLSLSASKDQGTFLLIYVNEYNIAVQAFALQGTVSDQSQWMEAIKKAQKLFMIAKLGQGSTNMMQMQTSSDNDLVSPSGLVTPGLNSSPAFPHAEHRRSSASSIMSLESDSDDESSVALPTRLRSDSALTSMTTISGTSVAMDARGQDGAGEEKDERVAPQLETELMAPEEELAAEVGAMALPRSESLSKISRSSSAPSKERPRVVESTSLSRSSSAPQGPTPERVLSLREGIIVKRRELEEHEGSVSSSSTSLNDSAVDSDLPSPSPFQSSSIDFPSLPPPEPQEFELTDEPQSNSELESSAEQDLHQFSSSPDETIVSPTLDSEERISEPDHEQEEGASFDTSEDDLSLTADSEGNTSVSQLGETSGSEVLQNLPDSLESSAKPTPHIKSQLLAQDKIQSAITPAEAQRKKVSLPRRSSPVVSRKQRPETFSKGQGKSDSDINGILRKIRDAQAAAPNAPNSESSPSNSLERAGKAGKIGKRSSESARCPVKPDKSHYPMSASLDLADSYAKSDSRKDKGYAPPPGSLSVSRKKSMSLSDLLNIGKDLTSSRWKDKESDKDKNQPQILEPLSPLSPSTDEETVSHTEGKKEEKKSRFSRLRRKSSRAELKDGIASGPNIDPKRASRHFFKESLMLESSEYV
ncbi:uncharacterized protein [Porites lutea]|uniref:uncharacterized protein isoform X5 n=1 Tax=Porites lutea TaxID=51062 RepID=UPI003CC65F08